MPLDTVAEHLPLAETFVHFALFVSMFALGAAAVFFLSEKEKILPAYRGTLTTSALICGVAAVAYYFLTRDYDPNQPFPTSVRYVDWTVTTPLLLLKYPEMLKVRGFGFGVKLVLADLWMILTGFLGEWYGSTVHGRWQPHEGVSFLGHDAVWAHFFWGTVSTLGYVYILYVLLFGEGRALAAQQPASIRRGIQVMNRYLWTLWGVYPLVFILEGLSAGNPSINLAWWQVVSSAADVLNKVGFGLTAYFAVKALSGDDMHSAERVPEPASRE